METALGVVAEPEEKAEGGAMVEPGCDVGVSKVEATSLVPLVGGAAADAESTGEGKTPARPPAAGDITDEEEGRTAGERKERAEEAVGREGQMRLEELDCLLDEGGGDAAATDGAREMGAEGGGDVVQQEMMAWSAGREEPLEVALAPSFLALSVFPPLPVYPAIAALPVSSQPQVSFRMRIVSGQSLPRFPETETRPCSVFLFPPALGETD